MGFQLPQVTRCCFFLPLRTGVLIIGYISGIAALLSMSLLITVIVLIAMIDGDPNRPTINDSLALMAYISFGAQAVVYMIFFILSIVLVVGAHKENPILLRISWRYMVVVLIINLVAVCVTAILQGFFATFGQIMGCAVSFYFVLVIRSFYIQLSERQNPPPDVELTPRTNSPLMIINQ